MDKLRIRKSISLTGDVLIAGAKNAALPIICAGLLTPDNLTLTNVPNLRDINTLITLLRGMGVNIDFSNDRMEINANSITNCLAPYELVKTMRAAVLVLGPLLARFGEAQVSLPGGCAIGARPVDQHIKGLELMGAEIHIEHGYIHAKAKKLHGAKIVMDVVTVTGTENLLMAATLASGTTILENCAKEPEVTDLANCLVKMGAKITGIGTDTLVIDGVAELHAASHHIIADRIEAGTYAVAAAITHGNLRLTNVQPTILDAVLDKLIQAGARIETDVAENTVTIAMHKPLEAVDIHTSTYPGFPTDMQAQFVTLNCVAHGVSTITENIFENRYMHVAELCRMGAEITTDGNFAMVKGGKMLYGATVMATDLRASASLVLAGLVADGETIIDRIYHLDRGYSAMEEKLTQVGADIIRLR